MGLMIKLKFIQKKVRYNDRFTNTIRIKLKKEVETFIVNSEHLHLTYVLQNRWQHRKIDKIKGVFDRISDTMKGMQIQLKYRWKRKGRHFLIKLKFLYNISDNIMEIHVKILTLKYFVVIFTDTMVGIQIRW